MRQLLARFFLQKSGSTATSNKTSYVNITLKIKIGSRIQKLEGGTLLLNDLQTPVKLDNDMVLVKQTCYGSKINPHTKID